MLTGNSDAGIEEFIQECSKEFKYRDMLYPKLFLGISIEQRNNDVILHQKSYIERILERFEAPENSVNTPMDLKQPLIEASDSELLNKSDVADY